MTDTKLITVDFVPGINKNVTEYFAEGSWVDCNKIRFRNGRPEKLGGWSLETLEQYEDPSNSLFTGVAREILAWMYLLSSQSTNSRDIQIYTL